MQPDRPWGAVLGAAVGVLIGACCARGPSPRTPAPGPAAGADDTTPPVKETVLDHGARVTHLALSSDGGTVLAAGDVGPVRSYPAGGGPAASELAITGAISDLTLVRDLPLAVIAGDDGIVLWNLSTSERTQLSSTATVAVDTDRRYGPGDRRIVVVAAVTGGAAPAVEVYEPDGRRCSTPLATAPTDVRFLGADLAVAVGDRVERWTRGCKKAEAADLVVGEPVLELAPTVGTYVEGAWLLVGTGSGARLFSVDTGQPVGPLMTRPANGGGIDLSLAWIVAGGRLHDFLTGTLVSEVPADGPVRVGDGVWFGRGSQIVRRDLPPSPEPTVEALAAIVGDRGRHREQRRWAARELGKRGPAAAAAAPALGRAMDLEDVAAALASIGGADGIDALVAGLPPTGRGRTREIAMALHPHAARLARVMPALVAAAEVAKDDDSEKALATLFGEIGPAAAPALSELRRIADGKSTAPREAALAAFARIGRAAVPALLQVNHGPMAYQGGTIAGTVRDLVRGDASSAVDIAATLATETDERALLRLVDGLGAAGSAAAGAAPALESLRRHTSAAVRDAADKALAAIR